MGGARSGLEETVHYGRCYSCGDEWAETEPIEVCPECGSRNVAEVAKL